MARAHPWNTTGTIANDGFNEYKTMNKTMFDPKLIQNFNGYADCRPLIKTIQSRKNYPEGHCSIQTAKAKKMWLVDQENVQKKNNEVERDVKMNITDFGSTFKRHEPDHERFFNLTTNQQYFDRPRPNLTSDEVIEKDGKRLASFAGYEARPESLKGIRMTSAMTSEVFKIAKDPQQNTRVQRSWLPYVEGAIKAAENNVEKNVTMNTSLGIKNADNLFNYKTNNAQVLSHDIATSLPTADGVYSLKSRYMEPGSFRRIRTDVTLIRNKPLSKK